MWPLSDLWSVRFEYVSPLRSFPSFKGQKSFTGGYQAAAMGAEVGFESWLERDVAMMLDFDPGVAFSSQPFRLSWSADGGTRRHVPDFFARLADGTGVVVDVRPDDRIEPEDAETFSATVDACGQVGWVFWRAGGPGLVLAANVRWLACYRHRRCYREDIAHSAAQVFAELTPLLAGARRLGDPLGVCPVSYHLIRRQVLTADLAGELHPQHLGKQTTGHPNSSHVHQHGCSATRPDPSQAVAASRLRRVRSPVLPSRPVGYQWVNFSDDTYQFGHAGC